MSDEPYTLCPGCQERIEPDEPGAVYVVELIPVRAMGAMNDVAEGLGAFFHDECSDLIGALGYRRRPWPGQQDDRPLPAA